MNMKGAFALLTMLLAMSAMSALEEFTLKPELADTVVDWTADASYVGDQAPADFGNAKVTVGVSVKVDATTAAGLSAIKWLYVSSADATLEIDSGSSDLEFEGAITGKGVLVKKRHGKGPGEVRRRHCQHQHVNGL